MGASVPPGQGQELALALLVAFAACAPKDRAAGQPPHLAERVVASNILRADYAGSAACEPCHDDIFERWSASPMRNMTRAGAAAITRTRFGGESWAFKGDAATFETHEGRRYLRLASRRFGDHTYEITRVIGGRHREDFAGVEVKGTGAGARRLGATGDELILPVSRHYRMDAFRLKGYSVMVGERPGLRAGGVWNQTCIGCHNTLPLFAGTWGALGDFEGRRAPAYQFVPVDRLLPRDRAFRTVITDEAAFAAAVADEVAAVGGDRALAGEGARAAGGSEARVHTLAGHAAGTYRARLAGGALVEQGIGCEACHGGAQEHVRNTAVHPSFALKSAFLREAPLDGHAASRAEEINRACARCHQVLFSRYPFTWEDGTRRGPRRGGSSINSGEARDMMLGACARAMSCVACHDPHAEDQPAKLAALMTPAGNAVCTTCHPAYADRTALRAHAHHDPAGAGGACLACHMPRKNMGLSGVLTAYHRIGSPSDKARVQGDRPLECALCHADKSVADLVGAMERWWGKSYDRESLRRLYGGDLTRPALAATLLLGKPHEQASAIAILGERRDAQALPGLVAALAHELPIMRPWAKEAIERVTGRPCAVDLDAPPAEIAAKGAACAGVAVPAVGARASDRETPPDED